MGSESVSIVECYNGVDEVYSELSHKKYAMVLLTNSGVWVALFLTLR